MHAIMINCPTTGKDVTTGIISGKPDFSKLSDLPGSVYCPMCKEKHQWAANDAWLAPAIPSLATIETTQRKPIIVSAAALSRRIKDRSKLLVRNLASANTFASCK